MAPTQARISWLLGAGISIPASLPSTQQITDRVLSGKRIRRHSDSTFYLDGPEAGDRTVRCLVGLLTILKREIDDYYSGEPTRHTNYEDLSYVVGQIHHSEVREYDNPAVQPLVEKVLPLAAPLFAGTSWKLEGLSDITDKYIHDVAWRLLLQQPTALRHLDCIVDSCRDVTFSETDLFTLNHDTNVEGRLQRDGLEFADGFGKPEGEVRYWDPRLFEVLAQKIRLFKLHGSTNWFRFEPRDVRMRQREVGLSLNEDYWHTKGSNGQLLTPVDGRPVMLTGTFNKILQYTTGIYADLHWQFYRRLLDSDILLACGYGFGDKAINSRVINWMWSSLARRLVIVHPHPEGLWTGSRGAIQNNWAAWESEKRVFVIAKGIENVSWTEIKQALA